MSERKNLIKELIESVVGGKEVDKVHLRQDLLKSVFNDVGQFAVETAWPEEIWGLIEKVAVAKATHVRVTGESGVGKSTLARLIHEFSPRYEKPFEIIEIGRLGENLVESEIFGHDKGAFTSAYHTRQGVFERVNGGTVLFDEFCDMPLGLQGKILRILNSFPQRFRRMGGNREIETNVRCIFTSSKGMWNLVKENKFRGDLYYRVNVVKIEIPPLRDQRKQIPALCEFFLQNWKQQNYSDYGIKNCGFQTISSEAMNLLMKYDWPGNIRQLKNAIERACVLRDREMVELGECVTKFILSEMQSGSDIKIYLSGLPVPCDLPRELNRIQKQTIEKALIFSKGNKAIAATMLGMKRTTVVERLKKLEELEQEDASE